MFGKLLNGEGKKTKQNKTRFQQLILQGCPAKPPHPAHTWASAMAPQAVPALFRNPGSEKKLKWLLSALPLAVPRLGLLLSGFQEVHVCLLLPYSSCQQRRSPGVL